MSDNQEILKKQSRIPVSHRKIQASSEIEA